MVFSHSNSNQIEPLSPHQGLCPLYLAQAHLFLIEKIPFPLVGLISALITATSRTFIIPKGQAAEATIAPAASLIQLRIEAIPL